MEDEAHALYLRDEIVTHEVQHDLDKLGSRRRRGKKRRGRGQEGRDEQGQE